MDVLSKTQKLIYSCLLIHKVFLPQANIKCFVPGSVAALIIDQDQILFLALQCASKELNVLF